METLQVKLVHILLAGFPKFSLVDLHVSGSYGVSDAMGTFPSVEPFMHSGSASWLTSLVPEKSPGSERSSVGSGGCILLLEECS